MKLKLLHSRNHKEQAAVLLKRFRTGVLCKCYDVVVIVVVVVTEVLGHVSLCKCQNLKSSVQFRRKLCAFHSC